MAELELPDDYIDLLRELAAAGADAHAGLTGEPEGIIAYEPAFQALHRVPRSQGPSQRIPPRICRNPAAWIPSGRRVATYTSFSAFFIVK